MKLKVIFHISTFLWVELEPSSNFDSGSTQKKAAAPTGSVSCCCRLFPFCDRRKPALCRGAVVYSRVASGSSPLCVAVLSFTLVLCPASARSVSWCCRLLVLRPAPAGSVSWCCRLLSLCVRLQPALCRGAVVYSCLLFSPLCVVVLSCSLVLRPAPAGSVSWRFMDDYHV